MKFHILTLFPEMVRQGLETSIVGRAVERGLIDLHVVNIRDHSKEKHGKVDDYTYGGGAGMLMQAQPVFDAWKSVCGGAETVCRAAGRAGVEAAEAGRAGVEAAEAGRTSAEAAEAGRAGVEAAEAGRTSAEAAEAGRAGVEAAEAGRAGAEAAEAGRVGVEAAEAGRTGAEAAEAGRTGAEAAEAEWSVAEADGKACRRPRTVYVTPQGEPFTQRKAQELAKEEELILLCGHYEGIDERVLEETVTDYLSIGDYVLTGGELAAMVIVDAVARLVPGVLGNEASADTESFHGDLLEYPQYSRPEVWHGKAVPEVLLSGNHDGVARWRLEQSVARTRERRPDLYARYERKERVVDRLLKHKRDNVHIIESLKRGFGEILYEDGGDILVYDGRCALAMMTVTDREKGEALLSLVPAETTSFQLSQEFMVPVLKKRLGMHVDMQCVNACYTARVRLPVRHRDVRPLTMEDAAYVARHYEHGNSAYLEERIRSGAMFGAYADGRLAGFAGEHEEGSIGMLFVHPDCRGQGIGQSLEAFLINRHLALGYTPYGQVVVGNEPSVRLQEKSGLYLSKGFVWWMSVGGKWQKDGGTGTAPVR